MVSLPRQVPALGSRALVTLPWLFFLLLSLLPRPSSSSILIHLNPLLPSYLRNSSILLQPKWLTRISPPTSWQNSSLFSMVFFHLFSSSSLFAFSWTVILSSSGSRSVTGNNRHCSYDDSYADTGTCPGSSKLVLFTSVIAAPAELTRFLSSLHTKPVIELAGLGSVRAVGRAVGFFMGCVVYARHVLIDVWLFVVIQSLKQRPLTPSFCSSSKRPRWLERPWGHDHSL